MIQPITFLTISVSGTLPSYTGSWSPYTLLLLVFMSFVSLVLLITLIAYTLMGRFKTLPPVWAASGEKAAPKDGDDGIEANSPDANSLTSDTKDSKEASISKKKAADSITKEKPLEFKAKAASLFAAYRKTGLLSLIGALLAILPATVVFFMVDNIYGRMKGLTFGTVLNLLLFIAQIVLIIRFIRFQRTHRDEQDKS